MLSARPSTPDGSNPRFVVTSLRRTRVSDDARALYEDLYCARGEAGNRIGEQFEMFADRASSATMAASQLPHVVLGDGLCARRYLARRVGLRHTQFADAAAQTIRLKLLRLGAQVRTSARAVSASPSPRGCPSQAEFALAHIRLQRTFSSA